MLSRVGTVTISTILSVYFVADLQTYSIRKGLIGWSSISPSMESHLWEILLSSKCLPGDGSKVLTDEWGDTVVEYLVFCMKWARERVKIVVRDTNYSTVQYCTVFLTRVQLSLWSFPIAILDEGSWLPDPAMSCELWHDCHSQARGRAHAMGGKHGGAHDRKDTLRASHGKSSVSDVVDARSPVGTFAAMRPPTSTDLSTLTSQINAHLQDHPARTSEECRIVMSNVEANLEGLIDRHFSARADPARVSEMLLFHVMFSG